VGKIPLFAAVYARCRTGALVSLSTLVMSCGDLGPQFVEGVGYKLEQDTVQLNVEMHPSLNLNNSVTIPLQQYGTLQLFSNGGGKGLSVQMLVNQSAIVSSDALYLTETARLPNLQQLPGISAQDMRVVKNRISSDITGYLFFTMDPKNRVIGAAADISYFADSVPADLVIMQKLRNQAEEEVGIVALYGPTKESEGKNLPSSGGIFVLIKMPELLKTAQLVEHDKAKRVDQTFTLYKGLMPAEDTSSNMTGYDDRLRLEELLKQVREKGEEMGLID
jgi:hypothetical protein